MATHCYLKFVLVTALFMMEFIVKFQNVINILLVTDVQSIQSVDGVVPLKSA
jgi:hypothetical protein